MSFLFWVVRENLIPASVPASRGWLALFGIPWLVGASPSSLLHLHVAFPFVSSHSSSSVQISLCVQISPYKSHTIGAHPNNFTSTWLFLQKKKKTKQNSSPYFQVGSILRYWGLGLRCTFRWGTVMSPYRPTQNFQN